MNAAEFMAAIRAAGLKPRSYSGRNMFGIYCVALAIDGRSEAGDVAAIMAVNPERLEELAKEFRETRVDSLGLGTIIYWPALVLSDDEAAALDDDDE